MSLNNGNGQLYPKRIETSGETRLYEHILNVPVLKITTAGGASVNSRKTYVAATFEMTNVIPGQAFTGIPGQIRGRGNSTWDFVKKPYKIRFDVKQTVLGMVANRRDWVLLANWNDRSHVRNSIAFELGRLSTGLPWSPTPGVYVEVELNGQKIGQYQLTDHIEVQADRLNIDSLKAGDVTGLAVTGGYSMEIDTRIEENAEPGFRTKMNVPILLDQPDGTITAQHDYIEQYFVDFEAALFGSNFTDPTNGYRKFIDINSFIDWYWINEFMANNDSGFGGSVKLYKKRDTVAGVGKLYLGPLWDFDLSMSIGAVYDPHPANVWWTRIGAVWIARMMEDSYFRGVLATRWSALKSSMLTNNYIYSYIDRLFIKLRPQLSRDNAIWSLPPQNILVPAVLKQWVIDRVAFIDSELASPADTTPPSVPTNVRLAVSGAYSLDVTWNASTDPGGDYLGTTGYRIWKNGVIDGVSSIPYADNVLQFTSGFLTPATTYNFEVQSRDATGNWSAKSSTVGLTTLTSGASAIGISVFQNNEPAPNMTLADDGTPVMVGSIFYTYGLPYSRRRFCVGGRVWCPAGVTLPAQVAISVFNTYNLDVNYQVMMNIHQAPIETKIVNTVTGPGWVEVEWDTPIAMTTSHPVCIAYQFVNETSKYVYTSDINIPEAALNPYKNRSPNLYLASRVDELPYMDPRPGMARGIFHYSNQPLPAMTTIYFGADIILNEPV